MLLLKLILNVVTLIYVKIDGLLMCNYLTAIQLDAGFTVFRYSTAILSQTLPRQFCRLVAISTTFYTIR